MRIKQVSETPILVTVVIALVAAAWWYDAINKQNGYQFSKQWPMFDLFIALTAFIAYGYLVGKGIAYLMEKRNPLKPRKIAGYVLGLGAFVFSFFAAKEGVVYLRRPTQSQIDAAVNQALVKTAVEIKQTLPKVLDASTTLTDVRVEGKNVVYMNSITPGYEIKDIKLVENLVRPTVCASEMRKSITDGVSYTYEYWSANPDQKLFGKFSISSCP